MDSLHDHGAVNPGWQWPLACASWWIVCTARKIPLGSMLMSAVCSSVVYVTQGRNDTKVSGILFVNAGNAHRGQLPMSTEGQLHPNLHMMAAYALHAKIP